MNIFKKSIKGCLYVILLISFITIFTSNGVPQENSYIIGQNDVINLTIFAGGEIQHNEELTVSAQGDINAPFVGIIKAEGLTPSQLEQIITDPLANHYFVDPKVNISIKQSKLKIYIEGEVKSPNAYDFNRELQH